MKKILFGLLFSFSILVGTEQQDCIQTGKTTQTVERLTYPEGSVIIPRQGMEEQSQNSANTNNNELPRTVVTFGTFDLFHIGHLRIIERAKALTNGGRLIVGISSDAFNYRKKQKVVERAKTFATYCMLEIFNSSIKDGVNIRICKFVNLPYI